MSTTAELFADVDRIVTVPAVTIYRRGGDQRVAGVELTASFGVP